MSKILLILIGFIVILLALIYLLYSLNIKKANTQIHWQKRQARSNRNKKFLNTLYKNEQQLKAIQELILITVKCRNFVQKLSSDFSNLLQQSSSMNSVWSGELHFMNVFSQENDQLVKDLNKFKLKQEVRLTEETTHFINQLIECMLENQEIIENIIHSLSDQQFIIDELFEFNKQITDKHTQLVDLHKWIINYFQRVFANSQRK